jgi:hypothetical protein
MIEVCALQRKKLVRARKEQIVRLLGAPESVKDAKRNIARYPDDIEFKQQFVRRLEEVAYYAHNDAEFSAMARQVINAYTQDLFGPEGTQ